MLYNKILVVVYTVELKDKSVVSVTAEGYSLISLSGVIGDFIYSIRGRAIAWERISSSGTCASCHFRISYGVRHITPQDFGFVIPPLELLI